MTFETMNFIVRVPKDGLRKLSCYKNPNSQPPIYNLGFGDHHIDRKMLPKTPLIG